MQIKLDTNSLEDYRRFLAIKRLPTYTIQGRMATFPDEYASFVGLDAPVSAVVDYTPSPFLFDYQRDISALAIRKRKFAVFADCGLGKQNIAFEFLRHVNRVLPDGQCALLQLDVIERLVKLYTNPGEIVFSPFAGVGSEGDGSLRLGRRFVGCELKNEYYDEAIENLELAEKKHKQDSRTLFDEGG